MKLVVVELPAKAKTIEKYLGGGHRVLASYGHVRDLPPKDGSVDPEHDFDMQWQVSPDRSKQLKLITDEAKKADTLILATDPDREGEAISWHVQEVLRQKKALPKDVQRVTFNAITNAAVTEAMRNPRELDEDLIDAYRARRALDYLVGFTLSPILWRKLPGAKSAGRVQSVALRLIVDREREIEVFKTQEYWQVSATFEADGQPFTARLVQLDGKKLDRLSIGSKGEADAAKAAVEAGRFTVASVETKPFAKNPPPPFTTSTLAAGGRAQARLLRQPHDAGRPVALRGRADHLHADRRRRHGGGGDQRRPQGDRQPLRQRLRAGQAAPLHEQGEERAGSARGDPADRLQPVARPHPAIMRACTSWSTTARWRARWLRLGWSARRSS